MGYQVNTKVLTKYGETWRSKLTGDKNFARDHGEGQNPFWKNLIWSTVFSLWWDTKVLTKYGETWRSKLTGDKNFDGITGKVKILFGKIWYDALCFLCDGITGKVKIIFGKIWYDALCLYGRQESSPVVTRSWQSTTGRNWGIFFQSCRSIHPRGLKIQIDSSGNFLTGEGQNRPVAKDDVIQCLVCDWNTRIDSNPDTVHSRETRVKSCMSRYWQSTTGRNWAKKFKWCRSKHPRGLKIQIDSGGKFPRGS